MKPLPSHAKPHFARCLIRVFARLIHNNYEANYGTRANRHATFFYQVSRKEDMAARVARRQLKFKKSEERKRGEKKLGTCVSVNLLCQTNRRRFSGRLEETGIRVNENWHVRRIWCHFRRASLYDSQRKKKKTRNEQQYARWITNARIMTLQGDRLAPIFFYIFPWHFSKQGQ